MKLLQKNRIRLWGVTGVVLCALVLSGAGYPDDGTVIIGPDQRNGADLLYNLSVEIPNQVSRGSEFTARLSIEGLDDFTTTSRATVNVTGGTLVNEQTQELSPDAVWKIRVTSDSLVGVVASVQTKIKPKEGDGGETTYLDTISGSSRVVKAGDASSGNNTAVDSAFYSNRTEKIIAGALGVLFILVFVGIFVFKKFRKKSPKNH